MFLKDAFEIMLVAQRRSWLANLLKQSAKTKPNRKGGICTFSEFRTMLRQPYRTDLDEDDGLFLTFADYLCYLFVAMTFLLGALRTTQFVRFRNQWYFA